MGRYKKTTSDVLLAATEETIEQSLILPRPHGLTQEQLIYAWELRYDPITDPTKSLACYRPHDPEWHKLPLAYSDLRIVVGACGTKASAPLCKSCNRHRRGRRFGAKSTTARPEVVAYEWSKRAGVM